ncbi:MAG: ParA family protein [Halanaeroarchaeum sp.]
MTVRTAALVGVAGGAGTTRTAVELAGVLARTGRSVLVFDLDFATQGLARRASGRIDPDATAVLTDPDLSVTDATIDWAVPGDGRLSVLPAFAPFVDVAAAKAPAAAERVGDRLREASATYDHVVVDVPPIAANQAIAGVDAADRVAAVLPASERGVEALQRTRGRLQDVGTDLDLAIAARVSADASPPDADLSIPPLPATPAPDEPFALRSGGPGVTAVADAAAALFEVTIDAVATGERSLVDRLRERLL